MQMRLHNVLRKELAHKLLNNYSVTKFCKAAGIGRGSFYNLYAGLGDLYFNSIEQDLKLHFREYRASNLKQLVYAFLREIGNNRVYYTNLYHLSKKDEDKHICEKIRQTLFKEMQNHLIESNFSNKHIRSMSYVIFSHVSNWLAHKCSQHVNDIYNEIVIVLPEN
ncbi:hypothetical protein [Lactobacillus ultunensis]|uniref:HTH tetR-type domain-containing protein n=1 Tax=Lactobacillus ultunensis DSM 16047 TaxID=525365 RepID=C2EQI3_9LACO|nr:hypothetical protein [Lactobacillus ultunensis]EEJ71197.1 hypothetical protein HMPREF0548_1929 [Lactobacillus ultunensis DSM 16047]QQP28757.1 transcriptional regulator [Lactobacillus ultunensis]